MEIIVIIILIYVGYCINVFFMRYFYEDNNLMLFLFFRDKIVELGFVFIFGRF